MCGIVGLIERGRPADTGKLARMVGRLGHRGRHTPARRLTAGEFGLGIVRLAVRGRDPDGSQPVRTADGRWLLVFNGEIYNCEALGARFLGRPGPSRADTEVLADLVEHLGTGVFEHLNGMFAIALVDVLKRRVHLARDRFGIKPLYYTRKDGKLALASETKAFLELSWFSREPDAAALGESLAFGSVSGDLTLFAAARSVPAGCVVTFDVERRSVGVEPIREGSASLTVPETDDQAALMERLGDTLKEAVWRQLVADVPCGIQMSGGVDSPLIAALAVECAGPLPLYTARLEGARDETATAAALARELGCRHRVVAVSPADAAAAFSDAVYYHEAPLHFPQSLGTYLVAREAARDVVVLLCGQGADEVFGGYDRYLAAAAADRAGPGDRLDHELVRAGALTDERSVRRLLRVPESGFLRRLTRLQQTGGEQDAAQRFMEYDQGTYLAALLRLQDSMTMAWGVEARVPYLDDAVVELARRLPLSMKVASTSKPALRKVAARYLGSQFAMAPKVGFDAPLGRWLDALRERFDVFFGPSADRSQYRIAAIRSAIDDYFSGRRECVSAHNLWGLLGLEEWFRRLHGARPLGEDGVEAVEKEVS